MKIECNEGFGKYSFIKLKVFVFHPYLYFNSNRYKMPKKYILPSELSWLSFNDCVLQEAADKTNPLYERIKFLAIHSSNLDEFYRVKISDLHSIPEKSDLFEKVKKEINRQQNTFGSVWKKQIVPELQENKIIYYENQSLLPLHSEEIENYFKTTILSYVQIVYLSEDENQEYFLNNRQLYLLIRLKNKSGAVSYCYINIPSDKLNRYKVLSPIKGKNYIISIDTIIKKCLHYIFPDQETSTAFAIKLNRDENYLIEDEASGNLVSKIKKKLQERKSGSSTRFLYDFNMPEEMKELCKNAFHLKDYEMIEGGTHHNFFDLFKFPNPNFPDLQNENFPPLKHPPFETKKSIFEVIDEENQLIHFPYQSYHYVLQFFNEAAIHKNVTEIKVTLYRISSQSLIANALISAAKNGKKVTVFVEVKARFDENNNLFWANEMQRAGIRIIYSMPNLKVHAKVALLTMRNGEKTKNYAYLSTGNFNENTAETYTDFGFFTSQKEYTDDLKQVFRFFKTKEKNYPISNLWVAGFNLKENILQHIDTEIQNAKNGKKGAVFMKINGLNDKEIINKLIEANNAKVEITLIVRGICTLLPGIKGFTENIKIYRIVDRYLEHSRIYQFHNDGAEKIYLSSADMLSRNLNRRIEVAFPIKDKEIMQEINTIISMELNDHTKKRVINNKGQSISEDQAGQPESSSQRATYLWYKKKEKKSKKK
ncbi:polyphosphate kinase 1 [Chryseobacterium paridis]|uniref:Polyphosphate kinase n=1 Tax=Chryseobacterium paridis TaxID=2800328 RepID=A0ABS1FUZ4_9FLAO|nr:polyphosphate kinase 1 [Chryseobacterium paridis]MBK1896225.1 polyphosphate kinase 1 [Chryseobacterium paridis]